MIYPDRYNREPRKRKAYCDAFDCIAIYGIKRNQWKYKLFNIDRAEMKDIWAIAQNDVMGRSKYDIIFGR